MKSSIVKRSLIIAGRKTSVSLEDEFWKDLTKIAALRETTRSKLVTKINSERHNGNLSSAIRLFVLDFYHNQPSKHQKRSRRRKQHHGLDGSKAKATASV